MLDINFDAAKLKQVITHTVGNKQREEGYNLSKEPTYVNPESEDYLKTYFLSQIQPVESYNFSHPVELDLNEVYVMAKQMFAAESDFVTESHNITKLLYEQSEHPKIKNGEVNIVLFDDIIVDDEVVEAIGIYKSETNKPFIAMDVSDSGSSYDIQHKFGYDLKGIDKGCLILNVGKAEGYLVFVIDNISGDAKYWLDQFLKVTPSSNDFYETKAFMDMTKVFLTDKLPSENSIDKTERIEMLNKTVDYFKENEAFDQKDFEENVLKEPEVIEAFRDFAPNYSEENQVNISESFGISNQAVKKQVRRYKSVLKLDKNFHIYITGGNKHIHKGVEPDGRKFYKIYYENEE